MNEGYIFIAVMALMSLSLVWLMGRFPLAFRYTALLAMLSFMLMVEYGILINNDLYILGEHATPLQLALLCGYLPMVVLFLLCSLLLLVLFLVVLIRPLRRRFAPRGARLLCFCSFSLIPLQLALFMDCCFNPTFFQPIIRGSFSLTVGVVVVLILLWNVGMDALARHLGSYTRNPRNR